MKILFIFGTYLLLSGPIANATRYVVKNPKIYPGSLEIVNTFTFDQDVFYIIEDGQDKRPNLISSMQFMNFLNRNLMPEAISEEAPIELVNTIQGNLSYSASGWHVRKLQYEKLPAKYAGQGTVVAILDTGIDLQHPALLNHLWVNKNEIPKNGRDDEKNGYIDDYHGYSFVEKSGALKDTNGHGTHCAGVVVADAHSPSEGRGVAPEAKIMSLKIISSFSLLSNAVAAIRYAVDNGANVLSNSWRIYGSWRSYNPTDANIELLRKAIKYASDHKVIFVSSSGNESTDINSIFKTDAIFPIGFKNIDLLVGVAASDEKDRLANFSNYGIPFVQFAAPGEDIDSTLPNGQWKKLSGTSMATPLIAGALARGLSRGMEPEEAISKLIHTSTEFKGFEGVASSGVINLVEYLK